MAVSAPIPATLVSAVVHLVYPVVAAGAVEAIKKLVTGQAPVEAQLQASH